MTATNMYSNFGEKWDSARSEERRGGYNLKLHPLYSSLTRTRIEHDLFVLLIAQVMWSTTFIPDYNSSFVASMIATATHAHLLQS